MCDVVFDLPCLTCPRNIFLAYLDKLRKDCCGCVCVFGSLCMGVCGPIFSIHTRGRFNDPFDIVDHSVRRNLR